ncbi:uncharacterized protein ASPGLDRAFT_664951 [Aspergillus glaucus CBS 516.65]|uniref:Uncharacterized protein n=1 Tax=Aspergillus glaucus CBS 516.65 TaxID=1160497 RepID=A0A1L9VBU9_ASPGL|nr:hypothetical protein ASPGLDRAFT_664951 [Aspergillus glaucus CBS 516.65]OJJ81373.1 hypothetical protein ASPGLDRAFT_664951 [Aspergillus glaucus CBS 516.65]
MVSICMIVRLSSLHISRTRSRWLWRIRRAGDFVALMDRGSRRVFFFAFKYGCGLCVVFGLSHIAMFCRFTVGLSSMSAELVTM